MVRKFKDMEEWARALDNEDRDDLLGPSPGGAAGQLGVSRQRVHTMIKTGKLDAISILRKGEGPVIFVTERSLKRAVRARKRWLKLKKLLTMSTGREKVRGK